MIDKIAPVRNPLTVIAMFAGIAEVSGTVVLPFLDQDTQHLYVWFLMGFPVLLVTAFFGTLLFKHHVLYAPSDYRDERNFVQMFRPGSPELRQEKLEEEASAGTDAENGAAGDAGSTPAVASTTPRGKQGTATGWSKSERAAQSLLAEDLAITRLASETQMRFGRNLVPSALPRLMFDAVGFDGQKQVIVEVKYSRLGVIPVVIMERLRERFTAYFASLSAQMQRETSFIIAVVVDGDGEARAAATKERLSKLVSRWEIPVQLRVYQMSDLQKSVPAPDL